MSSTFEQMKSVSEKLISAASKRRAIAKVLKSCGFISHGKGAWLGYRGRDIVSGLLIEGSPSDTYISSFVLPIFDELRFVNWSLGRRVLRCKSDVETQVEAEKAVREYCDVLLPVRSPEHLIGYIEESGSDGAYALWTTYLCMLRKGSLNEAVRYLDESKRRELHPSVILRLEEIERYVRQGDAAGVKLVLEQWEGTSRSLFGYDDFSLADAAQ